MVVQVLEEPDNDAQGLPETAVDGGLGLAGGNRGSRAMADRLPPTAAVRAGLCCDRGFSAVVPPIYLSTTYAFDQLGSPPEFDYSRSHNPTRQLLADALSELEGAAGAEVTASGMAAVSAAVFASTATGDRIMAPHDCYGGTWRLFRALADQGRCQVEWVDFTAPGITAAIQRRQPALVWLETPSNPLLRITDIQACAAAAHAVGAVVVVDNTFLSPVWQKPLALGADYVVCSTTKYLSGHSDVVGGAVLAATAERAEQVRWWCNTLGLTGGAFDSYLTLRGLRTLFPRMRAHEANAAAVVAALADHPALTALYYPGLPTHPGHELAARQQRGFGGIVSLDVGSLADRPPLHRPPAPLHSGRISRRRGITGLPSRADDPRRYAASSPSRRRDHAGPVAAVDRHRRPRRPDRRSAGRAGRSRLGRRRRRLEKAARLGPAAGRAAAGSG